MSQRALPTGPCVIDSAVRGVRLHVLREVKDARGDLCVAEVGPDLPFAVQRSFLVYNVPSAELRILILILTLAILLFFVS